MAAVVVASVILALAVSGNGGSGASTATTTTTSVPALAAPPTSTTITPRSTTTTTITPSRPQAGWAVASRSARGVLVDFRMVSVGGVAFRAVRLRARTTLLRWHVGSTDPSAASLVPADAGPVVDWPTEGRAGVVAVFNGAFKQAAHAGGSAVDGLTLVPLERGLMTIALDAAGHWTMGVWGRAGFPPRGFRPIALRQNLAPLVLGGRPTAAAASPQWQQWGATIGNVPAVARSGLGEDAAGNLVYVATMTPVTSLQLARALVAAGAVTAMELDINPFWPIVGASFAPLHAAGPLPVQLPRSMHSPTIYEVGGWTRDFFVALAEPASWTCHWSSPGVRPTGRVQPQPLRLVGRCH